MAEVEMAGVAWECYVGAYDGLNRNQHGALPPFVERLLTPH